MGLMFRTIRNPHHCLAFTGVLAVVLNKGIPAEHLTEPPKGIMMYGLRVATLLLTGLFVNHLLVPQRALAGQPRIQFDMPAVAVAYLQEEVTGDTLSTVPTPVGWKKVQLELRLSCINASLADSPMRQCIVRIQPRDSSLQIIDYAPRTEMASELTTPIQVKRIDEKSRSMGLSLDGNYANMAHGNIGSDHGSKNTESVQYDRAAPVQAVIASGTFERGRGVYFKLRWTDTQVLEGERRFQVTLCVPPRWRGELVDVSVVAEAEHRSLTSWESELKPIAAANFIVATYLHDDAEAASLAYQLAATEYRLRESAMKIAARPSPTTLPQILRHVAMKMDVDTPVVDTTWLARLLLGQADPHVDKTIRRLPADLRMVALDYVDARDTFMSLRNKSVDGVVLGESLARITDTESNDFSVGK